MFFTIDLIIAGFYGIISIFHILFVVKGQNKLYVSATVLNYTAVILHFAFFILQWVVTGDIPLLTVFHAFSFLSLILAAIFLLIDRRLVNKSLGSFAFPLIFVFQVISSFGFRISHLDSEVLGLPIFSVHTVSSVAGYGFFVYSMILGILYLYLSYELKQKKFNVLFDRLPSLETLNRMNGVCIVAGFALLSLGIATGSIMAVRIWKVFPLLDPKIFLSVVLWVFCIINIVFRHLVRWSGKNMSLLSVFSFVLIIIIFMVETFALPTIHRF